MSHTSQKCYFLGLYEDIKAAIRGLKMRYPIFVIEHGDYDLILGQSFLILVKFSQKYKPNSIFSTITHSQTQQLVIFQTLASQKSANCTQNQIFS